MNDTLREAFLHSIWATKTVIAICRDLSVEQRMSPAHGYGSILATLNHIVQSDAGYAAMLTGIRPAWASDGNDTNDLDQLEARVEEMARLWEQLLAEPFDAKRILILEDGAYECPASVVIAQALHHASAHREQIRGGIAGLGKSSPNLQPWAYADETGLARWREGKGR